MVAVLPVTGGYRTRLTGLLDPLVLVNYPHDGLNLPGNNQIVYQRHLLTDGIYFVT